MSELYLGLMSGTSMDGVDVALVDFSKIKPVLIGFETFSYPTDLLKHLHKLCAPGVNEIVIAGHADRIVAQCFAQSVNTMLDHYQLSANDITAIGSHGQTIRHHPSGSSGFTLQIGDPNTLAVLTGIDVIADFRRKDIALGGQGAPLAPAFHQHMFRHSHHNRVILNLGGIANITHIPADVSADIVGFDTGPANTLLDAWTMRHLNQSYDKHGQWAAQGKHHCQLLKHMLDDPFFAKAAPKSTGREDFNMRWLERHIEQITEPLSPQSVQATLVQLTAITVAKQIQHLKDVDQVFVCGGGAHNDFLMECLENELVECEVQTTQALGLSPDAIEAVAFAWLAYAYNQQQPGNIPSVTGASRAAVLGGLYRAT